MSLHSILFAPWHHEFRLGRFTNGLLANSLAVERTLFSPPDDNSVGAGFGIETQLIVSEHKAVAFLDYNFHNQATRILSSRIAQERPESQRFPTG